MAPSPCILPLTKSYAGQALSPCLRVNREGLDPLRYHRSRRMARRNSHFRHWPNALVNMLWMAGTSAEFATSISATCTNMFWFTMLKLL